MLSGRGVRACEEAACAQGLWDERWRARPAVQSCCTGAEGHNCGVRLGPWPTESPGGRDWELRRPIYSLGTQPPCQVS